MRSEELLDIMNRRPFQPYRFTFTGGETYDLTHPEMMIVGRSLVSFGTPSSEDERIAETFFYMSLLHIVKFEPLPKSAKSQNGKKRK
jgi:hypothetical protein